MEVKAFLAYHSTFKSNHLDTQPVRPPGTRKLTKKQNIDTFERGLELLHLKGDDDDDDDDDGNDKEEPDPTKLLFGKSVLDHTPTVSAAYTLLGHAPELSTTGSTVGPYKIYGSLGSGKTTLVLGQPVSGKSCTLKTFVEGAADEGLGRVPGRGIRTLVLSRAGHPSCGGMKPWNVPCEFSELVEGKKGLRKMTVFVPPEAYNVSVGIYEEARSTGRCIVRPLVFSIADLSPRHVAILMGMDELPDGVAERIRDLLVEAGSSPGFAGVRNRNENGWDYNGFRKNVDRFLNGDLDSGHRTALLRKLELFDSHVVEEILYSGEEERSETSFFPDFPTCSPSLLGHDSPETVLLDLRNPCVDVHTANALLTLTLSLWQTPDPIETTSGMLVLDDLDSYIDSLPNLRPLLQSLSRDDSVEIVMSATKPLKLGLSLVGSASTVFFHKMKPKLAAQVIEKKSSATEAGKIRKDLETLRHGEAMVWCENGKLYPEDKDGSIGQHRICRVRLRRPGTETLA